MLRFKILNSQFRNLNPDLNWAKILDPYPNSMYLSTTLDFL